jgi:hypothetical protein
MIPPRKRIRINTVSQDRIMMWRDVLFILHVPHTLLKEDNIVFVLHPVIDSLASPG